MRRIFPFLIFFYPILFSYVYYLLFNISPSHVVISYCSIGTSPDVISFEMNGERVSFLTHCRRDNISESTIKEVERLVKNGREINIWEFFQSAGIVRADEFEKIKKELQNVRELIKRGYFCEKKYFNLEVISFSSDLRGQYIIYIPKNRVLESDSGCDQLLSLDHNKVCIALRNGISIKFKKKIPLSLIGLICIPGIIFASILAILKKGLGISIKK